MDFPLSPQTPRRRLDIKDTGQSRASFVRRLTLSVLAAVAPTGAAAGADPSAPSLQLTRRKNSRVKRWDVITLGNLSRNQYWGEADAKAVRSAICTCTVVQGEGFRLIADPSIAAAEQMAAELDRRTGLKLTDIDTAFVTHEHADHWMGLAHFTSAKWYAAPEVATALNKSGKLAQKVIEAPDQLYGCFDVLPTPGHTMSHHSLRFDCDDLSIVLAGDAVATRDFWRERRGYYNCVDFALSSQSMEKIERLADLVVPGHDNFFLTVNSRR